MNDNPHIGESFESFLRDEGICEEVTAEAVRRVGRYMRNITSIYSSVSGKVESAILGYTRFAGDAGKLD